MAYNKDPSDLSHSQRDMTLKLPAQSISIQNKFTSIQKLYLKMVTQ